MQIEQAFLRRSAHLLLQEWQTKFDSQAQLSGATCQEWMSCHPLWPSPQLKCVPHLHFFLTDLRQQTDEHISSLPGTYQSADGQRGSRSWKDTFLDNNSYNIRHHEYCLLGSLTAVVKILTFPYCEKAQNVSQLSHQPLKTSPF